ncbi:MAG: hypothetical protein QMD13_09350 [Candidatus Bathyarchaeia archaeon]|nr:hypothetical protein [Candidatus Bathyarchaeia archaeon]
MPRIKGSEQQIYGSAVYTIVIDPGAVAANTNIPLPAWAKGAQNMLQCIVFKGVDQAVDEGGTAKYTITTDCIQKTVVKAGAAPAAGEACLYDKDNVRVGDAIADDDVLFVTLLYKSFTVEI